MERVSEKRGNLARELVWGNGGYRGGVNSIQGKEKKGAGSGV